MGDIGSKREEERFEDGEYEVEDLREQIKSSRSSRLDLLENELGIGGARRKFSREKLINGIKDLSRGFVILPEKRFRISIFR
ncbi:hypothetical protein SLEP1_g60011 [Rubroshorea leprosula]|uniref:Uncharacterized protein n=1 Tax=Rubroshorea leprosula TaxID=152421 RepID=A0AAV5MU24_9ROSI|nr:hypothetical protein SLEP1_g60011 [Rubroshorea leprosula]